MTRKQDTELELAWNLFDRSYGFARATEAASEELIRKLLEKLEAEQPRHPASLFLRAAFDETAPRASWKAGVNALKVFGAFYSWGSKTKRDKLSAIAQQPRLVAAAQTAAVGADSVPDEYLAVLALEASDASLDALYPHFEAAMKDPTRLDGLARLTTFAKKTPAMTQLLARATKQLEVRQSSGAVLELARELGIMSGARFRVHVRGGGTNRGRESFDVMLDSAGADDYRVWTFAASGRTTFSAHAMGFDDLKLGRCSLPELPAWLAKAGRTAKVTWDADKVWSAYLRGKRLQTFLDWLLGVRG